MVKIVLTMQRVQSLVRELISHMLCGSAKKWGGKKLKKKGNKFFFFFFKKEGNSDTCSSTNNLEDIVISYVRLFGTPWTLAHQAPLSMGFLRQG